MLYATVIMFFVDILGCLISISWIIDAIILSSVGSFIFLHEFSLDEIDDFLGDGNAFLDTKVFQFLVQVVVDVNGHSVCHGSSLVGSNIPF